MRWTALSCSMLAAIIATAGMPVTSLEVRSITLYELAARSDLILTAEVSKLTVRADGTFASATPIEFWKGTAKGGVEYSALRTDECDITEALPGERVVLFLSTDTNGRRSITHLGRGRFPVLTLNGQEIATYWSGVIFPEGTPVINVKKELAPYRMGLLLSDFKQLVLAAVKEASEAQPPKAAK